MPYLEVIKAALDYIEENLKTRITAEELAQRANYSTYHFCRLFSMVTGSSVAGYILKRRLDHALAEIAGGRRAIKVVLEYGFDTYAGFYKAFIKMYGCSPRQYLRLYQGHQPTKPEVVKVYTEKELRKILANWAIPENLPVRDLYRTDGAKVSGKVWQVGEDYLLKAGDRGKMMKNLKIAKALHGQGFASSLPVPTKTGHDYWEEQEVFILTRGLKGGPLPKAERFGARRVKFAEEYGRSIARLHKALKSIQKELLCDEVNLDQHVRA